MRCFIRTCEEELEEKRKWGITTFYECKKGHRFKKLEDIDGKKEWYHSVPVKYEWAELSRIKKPEIDWSRVPK